MVNREKVLKRMAEVALRQTRERAARGEGADGAPWAAYASTGDRRGRATLSRTGRMFRSLRIVQQSRRGAVLRFVGSRGRVARFHARGTRKMPARPLLGLPPRDRKKMTRELDRMKGKHRMAPA